ncbi:MAG: glucose-6-phosphate dehydrogenase [Bifidobacteriaceae bacterium]|nr:glucose-6-phosphate dehydrogenase [Bifidobacteriaceae bacterium]
MTGDLARRKVMPAIYDLANRGLLPAGFSLTGVARSNWTTEQFLGRAHAAVASGARTPFRQRVWEQLTASMTYISGDITDPATYAKLGQALDRSARDFGTGRSRVFYLSMPPSTFETICRHLAASGLARSSSAAGTADLDGIGRQGSAGTRRAAGADLDDVGGGAGSAAGADGIGGGRRTGAPTEAKVVIEKPFGRDLASARKLDATLAQVFDPASVFRIDHYLGKETVRGMLATRFANQVFEPLWSREYVDHVQITMAEELGVGSRASYYDSIGATRDVIQNHLLQLLAITAMEAPESFHSADLRAAKEAVLKAVQLAGPVAECAVRGQYQAGWQGNVPVPGYLEEAGIPADSRTDTYGALKLAVDTERWRGVPFYLRTGKRLGRRVTEVAITFRRPGGALRAGLDTRYLGANALVIRIQPDEGITLRVGAKVPQTDMAVRDVTMDFSYGHAFTESLPDAYERLILDVLLGSDPLFPRAQEVDESWRVIDPVESYWASLDQAPEPYEAGTWGPARADELLRADGREWRRP